MVGDKVEIRINDIANSIPHKVLNKIFNYFLLPSQQDKEQAWV